MNQARRLRTALGLTLLIPVALAAQTRPTGTGTLAGRVMRDNTPVARALVSIDAGDGRAERVTATNDDGEFIFNQLPAGRYLVKTSKYGWLATHYGSPRPGRPPGVRVAVEENARVNISIPMTPGSVIAGRIVDTDGTPQAHVFPVLMETRTVGDRQVIDRVNLPFDVGYFEQMTDDRGEFRLYGLPPGTYYLAAAPRRLISNIRLTTADEVRWATQSADPKATPPPQGPVASSSTVYFPGTPDVSQAQPIVLGAAEVRDGLTFRLVNVPVANVKGIVRTTAGTTTCARITLDDIDSKQTLDFENAGSNGAFTLGEVPPGEYRIAARSQPCAAGGQAGVPAQGPRPPAQPVYWGQATIRVNGQDIDGLGITLEPASTISGRLIFDGKTMTPPADLPSVRLRLFTPQSLSATEAGLSSGGPESSYSATVAADGSFRVEGLPPDRYVLAASWPNMRAGDGTTGWWLSSVRVGDRDYGVEPIDVPISANLGDVAVTFRDRIGSIEGLLTDAAGKPAPEYFVMVFPVERALWTSASRRSVAPVRPGTDGRYRLIGLQAGDYYLAVVTSVSEADAIDPRFLNSIVPSAVKVTLADGATVRQDLKIAK